MNYYLIGFLLLTTGGLIFLAKTMKLGKEDWVKFKKKIKGKEKKHPAQIELEKNGLLLPCDERNYADLTRLKTSMKKYPKILTQLNDLPKEFEKFNYSAPEVKQ